MLDLSLPLIAVLGPFPINHWLERKIPRRRGEMRPSTMWLAIGATLLTLSALLGMRAHEVSGFGFLAVLLGFGGTGAIVYFFHRRVIFGRRGVYEWRYGRLANMCAYRDVHRCSLGADVASRALELETKHGRVLAAPGFVDRRQIEDAFAHLHNARIRLPDARDVKARLGIDLNRLR